MMGFGLLFVAHAVFGNYIYEVDRTVGTGSVKGTIETNALGLLTNATLKDFRLQLTDGIGHAFELKYPDDTPSTSYSVVGDALTATDAALIFDWNRPNTRSQFSFFDGSELWDWILQTKAMPATTTGDRIEQVKHEFVDFGLNHESNRSPILGDTEKIALRRVSNAPEPTSLAVLSLGLVALGFGLKFRRRRPAAVKLPYAGARPT